MTPATRPGLAAAPNSVRRVLFSLFVLGVFLSAWTTRANAQVEFDQYEVVTGAARHETVLTGFLLGGAVAELAVVGIDERGERRLRMYGFDGDGWVSVLETTLRPEVLFVDVASIGSRDRLITYGSGRLDWLDPDTGREHPLVEVAWNYRAGGESEINAIVERDIPHVDITRDLNHDGRDDVIVPDADGFRILIQRADGSFSDAVKLGPPEPFLEEIPLGASRSYGEIGITASTIPWYLSRVYELDYNRDGRSDLAFWNGDHFDIYPQDARGLFGEVAETLTPDIPFDGDGAYSLVFGFSDVSTFKLLTGFKKKTRRTALHTLADLNGDGIVDLVLQTLEGRSLLKQRSVYEVHFGREAVDGLSFSREADTAIRPQGRAGGLQASGYASQRLQDLDGDDQIDLMLEEVKVGIGGMMRALVGNSVPIDLEFYRVEDGIYPSEPTTRRSIRRFAPFAGLGNVFFPAVVMGDLNGDGRQDLLVGRSPKELHVYVGVPGPDLLARRPRKVAVDLPSDERDVWLVDLNQDGRQDVLIHRTSTARAPTRPHSLTTLIARCAGDADGCEEGPPAGWAP